MSDSTPKEPERDPSDDQLTVVLGGSSPRGEDVVVRLSSLPSWWEERAPRLRMRRRSRPAQAARSPEPPGER